MLLRIAARLCAMLLAAPAWADPTVAQAWERFKAVCTPAFEDAQAFVDGVSGWAPAGSYATMTSPDGRMFKLQIQTPGYYDGYERVVLKNGGSESCSVQHTSPNSFTAASGAAALEAIVRLLLGPDNVIGGQYPELYRDKVSGGAMQTNMDNYQYVLTDVFSDPGLITYVQVVSGWMSISASREVGVAR